MENEILEVLKSMQQDMKGMQNSISRLETRFEIAQIKMRMKMA